LNNIEEQHSSEETINEPKPDLEQIQIKKNKVEVFKLNQEKAQLENQITCMQIARDKNDIDTKKNPKAKKKKSSSQRKRVASQPIRKNNNALKNIKIKLTAL